MRFDTGSHLWGREIAKKEADHARLVGDGFNKKKNIIHMRLIWSSHKTSRPLTLEPESSKFT